MNTSPSRLPLVCEAKGSTLPPLRRRGFFRQTILSTWRLPCESRVILTHDRHFLQHAAAGVAHAGIAYCHQNKYSIGALIQALLLLHACYTADEIRNRVEYL